MRQKDCFYNKSAPGVPSHPWVIVSDPIADPDNVLIVNLTDVQNIEDLSCVLDSADAPGFLTKQSAVA